MLFRIRHVGVCGLEMKFKDCHFFNVYKGNNLYWVAFKKQLDVESGTILNADSKPGHFLDNLTKLQILQKLICH